MEKRNPKKSKALIITFVIVLALLIGGYFLFTRTNILTKTGIVGKVFAPLLGTSKQKDLATIQETETTPTGTTPGGTTPGGTTPGGTTPGGTTPGGTGPATPGTNPFPTPNYATCYDGIKNQNETRVDTGGVCTGWSGRGTCYDGIKNQNETRVDTGGVCSSGGAKTQCNDGIDNDGDTFIDSADAGCHTDFDKTNPASYEPNLNNESSDGTTPKPTPKPYQCPTVELYFTDDQKAELADLNRQYYRIAATLHTTDDIAAEVSAKKSYQDLVNKSKALTKQCKDQTSSLSSYGGPIAKRKNPYYASGMNIPSYFYTGENNNTGINEPVMQSLMNITNIIKKYSDKTQYNMPIGYLKMIVNNVLGPEYEQGVPLPKIPHCTDVGSSFGKGGNYLAGNDICLDDLANQFHWTESLFYPFVYGQISHTHSCEGLFDYTGAANGTLNKVNAISPSTPIITECNDGIDNNGNGKIDSQEPGCHTDGSHYGMSFPYNPAWTNESTYSTNFMKNTKWQCNDGIDNDGDGFIDNTDPECNGVNSLNNESTTNFDTLKASKANDAFGIFNNNLFSSVKSQMFEFDFGAPDENMNPVEKKACNDIYGLRLLLSRTSNAQKLKSYISNTIPKPCSIYSDFVSLQTCSENTTSKLIPALLNNGSFNTDYFDEIERMFNIW